MKLSVDRNKLVKALQKVINIIGTRSTLPVLGNVLIATVEGKVEITTTDLEIRISTVIDADIQREGKTTLPAKKLYALVNKFIDDVVNIDCNEKHHSEIICGTSKFKLLGLAADDFPLPVDFTPHKFVKFKENDFARMIDQISYAVSLDDSRKVLHGILCSIKENTVTAVATDGKRLALSEKVPEEVKGEEGDVIIPLKAANEVKRILDTDGMVTLEIGEKQAMFITENVKVSTKLIEGNYPNYRQVIPASFSKVVEVDSSVFAAKLDLVSLALADSSSYVIISFENNKLSFEASSSVVGEGNDYIDIDYNEEKLEISFNPHFLADPLRHCDSDKVKVKLNDNISPVAIEGGDGFLYVIMPMRNR